MLSFDWRYVTSLNCDELLFFVHAYLLFVSSWLAGGYPQQLSVEPGDYSLCLSLCLSGWFFYVYIYVCVRVSVSLSFCLSVSLCVSLCLSLSLSLSLRTSVWVGMWTLHLLTTLRQSLRLCLPSLSPFHSCFYVFINLLLFFFYLFSVQRWFVVHHVDSTQINKETLITDPGVLLREFDYVMAAIDKVIRHTPSYWFKLWIFSLLFTTLSLFLTLFLTLFVCVCMHVLMYIHLMKTKTTGEE